jgi:cytochrome c biogenesis protein
MWRFLGRLDLAAVLILVVLLVAAFGSCFPQLSSSVAADPERLARWAEGVRARYGALTDLLAAGGAFSCFSSAVFLVPLTLLATVTLACTLDRWRAVWRRAFHQRVRCSDVALDTAPHVARLTALPATDLPNIARQGLEQRGFRVRREDVGDVLYLRGDRNWLAPLATLVTHLAVLLLLLGVLLSSRYGWREEITIGPGETVEVGHGSELALRNDGFTIVRYPDGSAANYEAQVTIVEGSRERVHSRMRVNEPLSYRSVGFHVHGYQGIEDQYSVTLLAVHDPGYGLVVVAGFLLLVGLTVSSHFPHCWVHVRMDSEGTLRLAGRADRHAGDWGREFAALVEEIQRSEIGTQTQ